MLDAVSGAIGGAGQMAQQNNIDRMRRALAVSNSAGGAINAAQQMQRQNAIQNGIGGLMNGAQQMPRGAGFGGGTKPRSGNNNQLMQAMIMIIKEALSNGNFSQDFNSLIDQMQSSGSMAFNNDNASLGAMIRNGFASQPRPQSNGSVARENQINSRPQRPRPQSSGSMAREGRINNRPYYSDPMADEEIAPGFSNTGSGPGSYDPNRRGPK